MTIPAVAFVGRSGSGKTTLIEALVPVLMARGLRVAVVKHAPGHGVETDVRGTDTYRFWEAGAAHVTLVTRDRIAHVHRHNDGPPPLDAALDGVNGVDVVILEGFKGSRTPKIEVIRAARDSKPIEGLEGRIACVSDVPKLGLACPRFEFDDLEGVAGFIVERVLAPQSADAPQSAGAPKPTAEWTDAGTDHG